MASDEETAATLEDTGRPGPGRQNLDASELPRGRTIDRYVVIDKVGQGGMGVVYSAYDHVLDRRVALKLVTSRGRRDGDSLLLAEARAMAQLSHPAIVPVHDIGEFRGQVFLAMAFVDGTTLRAWQARAERPWQEIADMYRLVGEGLAFAHDEGIIHRDFKPDNVLVDADGRPHITDFGLAKIVLGSETPAPAAHTTHTLTGRIAGTPGYMSPEQSRSDPTDARTDQYAFCVSLFEALHGALPAQAPTPRAEVPRYVVAAIQRGLADAPADRWPSMHALLAALAPPRSRRRARMLVGASVSVAAAVAVGALLYHGSQPVTCKLPQATALWQARRAGVQAAFASHGDAGAELVAALDTWTTRWTDMAEGSCLATERGSQSSQLLDLRARCLEHALDITSSLIDLASRGDPDLARHVTGAVGNLPSLEPCADTAGLLGLPSLPADPMQRATIATLERQLARTQALLVGESFRAASDLLDTLVEPVKATGYSPLIFELYDTLSGIEIAKQADPDAAAAAAWAAVAADPARHDLPMARLWIDLVWIVGVMQHAPAQAIEIGHVAEALVTRTQDKHQIDLLDHRLATVLVAAGKLDDAISRYDRAIAGFAAEGDVYDEIAAIGAEATAYGSRNDTAKQLALFERAIALAGQLPHAQLLLADLLSEISIVHMEAGHYNEARAALQRAVVAIGDGSDAPALLAAIHGNLGNVAEREGDLAAAEREYRTEVELAQDKLGPEVSDVQIAWYNLGQIEHKRSELADALASLHHALDILQHAPKAAAQSADYAGPGELARQLVLTQLALGHAADALADAQACLVIAEHDEVGPGILADVHFALASATWATGNRERARALMRSAATEYHAAHSDKDDADGWLAAH